MGVVFYEIALIVVVSILILVITVGSAWFVKEHDKRASYWKQQAEICWKDKHE